MRNAYNVLLNLHTAAAKFPVAFRERVCEKCNWTPQVFYRKLRTKDKNNEPALTIEESRVIKEVITEVYLQLGEQLQQR